MLSYFSFRSYKKLLTTKEMFKSKKIEKCKIALDNDRLVFYPGETLKGKFILEMSRSMNMKGIKAVCKGKTKTEWKQTVTDDEGNHHEYEYESKHKFFEMKSKIYGKIIF